MALYVPLLLLGVAVAIMVGGHLWSLRRTRQAAAAPAPPPRILVHAINDDRCTGCDACVAVCPTDVLDLQQNKSRVVRFADCIQCEQCMYACPTRALVMHWEDEEPPPIRVPNLDGFYQTAVPGMYLIGEVAGKPLIKNAANVGRAVVEHMLRQGGLRPGGGAAARRRAEGSDAAKVTVVDVAIVGSGPGGLSAALTCIHHGLSYVVLEKEQLVASTIARYPKGKEVMAEPYGVRNLSFLPVFDATKEQLLPAWQALVERVGVDLRRGEAVERVERQESGAFDVRTTVAAYRAQRIVLATGTRGKPRTLGVPGENLPKVATLLDDPAAYAGQDVLVVGGGDSAVEAACALADAGARVTLSYRGRHFHRVQGRNRDRLRDYEAEGRLDVRLQSAPIGFDPDSVTLASADGGETTLPNAAAFVLIGADAPVAWLEKLGVGMALRPHWWTLAATDQLVESLVGRAAAEPPRDPAALAELVRRGARAAAPPAPAAPPPEPSVVAPLPRRPTARPKFVPAETGESSVFTSARHPARAIPLGEFVASGASRRPRPHGEEVTRVLRTLRDEGARLAYDDSKVELVKTAVAPPPAPPTPPPTRAIIDGLPPRRADGRRAVPPRAGGRRPTPGQGVPTKPAFIEARTDVDQRHEDITVKTAPAPDDGTDLTDPRAPRIC